MSSALQQDHFALFGLPRHFELDLVALEQAYREVQSQVHPDRFATMPHQEQRVAMQWAAQANEAYRVLKKPLERAAYLLRLQGHDPQEESNTAMPVDFLMAQMEWREAIEEAAAGDDVAALEDLGLRLRQTCQDTLAQTAEQLAARQWSAAAQGVRQLRFLDKLDSEIGDALEAALTRR